MRSNIVLKLLLFIAFYMVWVTGAGSVVFGAFTSAEGDIPFLAVILYLVVIMIPIVLFIKWFNSEPAWMKKVRVEGKQAAATILSVKDTGIVINRTVAVVKLQLRVEPADDAPFEVSQQQQISLLTGLGGFSAGAHVQVKYDPNNKKHVIILNDSDTTSGYTTGPITAYTSQHQASVSGVVLADELAKLSALHKSGELSDSEFEKSKKKLLN